MNEEQTVADVVLKVKELVSCDVVVIDDAGDDGTSDAARAAGAVLLPHAVRLGAWGAVRTGFRYAVRHGYEIAVTMDADGQHSADSIMQVAAPVKNKQSDVVIGSCLSRGTSARKFAWPWLRRISMLKTWDITSGLRAYNRAAFSALVSDRTALLDYQDIGTLLYLKKNGFRIMEIPVKMNTRAYGKSKVFSSWGAVIIYLYKTLILCLSKMCRESKPDSRPDSRL